MGEEMRVKGSEVAEELITAADYDKVLEYVLKGTPPPRRRSNNNLKILERVALFSLEMIKLHMDEELAGDNIKRLKTTARMKKKRPMESAADPDPGPPLLKVCLLAADAVPTKKRSPRRPSKDPHDYQDPKSLKKHKYHHPAESNSSNCSDLYEHPNASNSPVDVDAEEWHPESISEKEIKRKKKKKKAVSELLNRNPRNPLKEGGPAWREIPVFVSEMMERMKGSELVLVIEKALTNSDMNRSLSRLQMPESQMNKFLREEEMEHLKMKQGTKMNGIEALLHQPDGELSTKVTLRRWEMLKGKNSGGSIVFVLASGWNQVVARNMLRSGDTIQVWSFRVNNHLHFALLKIH